MRVKIAFVILLILALVIPVSAQDSGVEHFKLTKHEPLPYTFSARLSVDNIEDSISPEILVGNPFVNPPAVDIGKIATPDKATLDRIEIYTGIQYPNGTPSDNRMDGFLQFLESGLNLHFFSMIDADFFFYRVGTEYEYLDRIEYLVIHLMPFDWTEELVYQISVCFFWSVQWIIEDAPEEPADYTILMIGLGVVAVAVVFGTFYLK